MIPVLLPLRYNTNIKDNVELKFNLDMNTLTVPLSDARRNLTDLIANVTQTDGQPVMISVRGKPTVVLISADTYEDYLKKKYREEFKEIFDELDDLNKSLVNK